MPNARFFAEGRLKASVVLRVCLVALPAVLALTGGALAQTPPPQNPGISATPTPPPPYTFQSVASQAVLIPANTPVAIHVDAPLSSQQVKAGDTFAFTVEHNVVVNGMLVIKKGASGQGHVQDVAAAAYHVFTSKPGYLTITLDWVTAIDGEKVLLAGTVRTQKDWASVEQNALFQEGAGEIVGGTATQIAAASIATTAGTAFIPYVGAALSFVHFGRGSAASLGPQDTIVPVVHYAVHVTSDTAAKQYFAPGFAH